MPATDACPMPASSGRDGSRQIVSRSRLLSPESYGYICLNMPRRRGSLLLSSRSFTTRSQEWKRLSAPTALTESRNRYAQPFTPPCRQGCSPRCLHMCFAMPPAFDWTIRSLWTHISIFWPIWLRQAERILHPGSTNRQLYARAPRHILQLPGQSAVPGPGQKIHAQWA